MKYQKSWISINEQIALLTENKGLKCSDQRELERALVEVGYYRLSAYWFPYKTKCKSGITIFREGTTFETIICTYEFDRALRQLMFDAVGRIEIYLRSRIAYPASEERGPFCYPDVAISRLKREFSAAKKNEQYIKHFAAKYGDEQELPPYWVMVECVTMGTIELLYSEMSPQTKATIANEFGVKVPILKNWISVLRVSRNACCHHSRVWNRTWGVKPMIPKAWKEFRGSNDKTFAVLSVLYYMLESIGESAQWRHNLEELITKFSDIPLEKVGFYKNWRETVPWA